MSHAKRIFTLASLILLFASPTLWAVDINAHFEQKQETVRAALEDTRGEFEAEGLAGAIHRAHAFTAIEVDSSVAQPEIRLHLTGKTPYLARASSDTFTIDLFNVVAVPKVKTLIIDGGNTIGEVSTRLTRVHPQFVTRLEVTLMNPAAYRVDRRGTQVTIVFTPNATPPTLSDLQSKAEAIATRREHAVDRALSTFTEARLRADAFVLPARKELSDLLKSAFAKVRESEIRGLANELASLSGEFTPSRILEDVASTKTRIETQAGAFRAAVGHHLRERRAHRDALRSARAVIQEGVQKQRAQLTALIREGEIEKLEAFITELDALETSDEHTLATILRDIENLDAETLERFRLIESALPSFSPVPKRQNKGGLSAMDSLDRQFASFAADSGKSMEVATPATALQTVEAQLAQYALDNSSRHALLLDPDETSSSTPAPPGKRNTDANSRPTPADQVPKNFQRINATGKQVESAAAAGALKVAPRTEPLVVEAEVVSDAQITDAERAPGSANLPSTIRRRPASHLYNPDLPADQDPLRQPVNIDFVEMDLSTVVGLLARKAQINVIASEELAGSVTANFQDIPLGSAIEAVLRLHNLGIIEEAGLYRITSYEEAVASRRETRMIPLKNASAIEVKQTLQELVTGMSGGNLLSVAANSTTNYLILSGPSELVDEFEPVVRELDIAKAVIPTVTRSLKLNYSDPSDMLPIVQPILSETGTVTGDPRGRHLIVTDLPVKVEEIERLIKELDIPVKQVSISAMIVDAVLSDDAQTGIDWTLNAIRRSNRDGELIGNLAALQTSNDFTTGPVQHGVVSGINLGSQLLFNILSGDFDIMAAIAAEVRSENAELLSNPTLLTLENKLARIVIAREIPFQELTQTTTGPPIATTEFKEVGTVLEVLCRVTHNNEIIVELNAKQSDTKGESVTGVPPEDKREAQTTVRLKDGQTIFIGGLRRFDDELSVRKVPILGDIPFIGALFRNQRVVKEKTELLVFLTCHIMPETMPDLTPYEKTRFDKLGGTPDVPDATRALVHNYIHPEDQRDPFYKWRRAK